MTSHTAVRLGGNRQRDSLWKYSGWQIAAASRRSQGCMLQALMVAFLSVDGAVEEDMKVYDSLENVRMMMMLPAAAREAVRGNTYTTSNIR